MLTERRMAGGVAGDHDDWCTDDSCDTDSHAESNAESRAESCAESCVESRAESCDECSGIGTARLYLLARGRVTHHPSVFHFRAVHRPQKGSVDNLPGYTLH